MDQENYKINSLTSQGKMAGGRIEFRADENPIEQIIGGKIVFHTYIAPWVPAEVISDILEFDPTYIESALGGE